jgi:hypothetical protein
LTAAKELAFLGSLPARINQNVRLVIALVLLARLLLEPQPLVEGVVQLRVRVGNLLLADKRPKNPSVSELQDQHAAQRHGITHSNLSQRPVQNTNCEQSLRL